MLEACTSPRSNRLLASLSLADFALLQPNLESVALTFRLTLEAQGRSIEHVYFIEQGIASVATGQAHETRAEIGLIGSEGMSGLSVVLGSEHSSHSTYVRVGGCGQRCAASALREALNTSSSLRGLLLKYVQVFLMQTAHAAAAIACARLDERLARLILMTHDRIGGPALPLTHELLAQMLSVQRPRVTAALARFESHGLLELERRKIAVIDRKRIEEIAGHFYGAPEAEYLRLIG